MTGVCPGTDRRMPIEQRRPAKILVDKLRGRSAAQWRARRGAGLIDFQEEDESLGAIAPGRIAACRAGKAEVNLVRPRDAATGTGIGPRAPPQLRRGGVDQRHGPAALQAGT